MIKSLYHFLGGVKFAIFLIASVTVFVIAGTIIESKTESHNFAASLTYHNPIFSLLLWGFFINILFSATRRFPFKKRHIPFLITHLGLLMILGGVLIKSNFGTQGSLTMMEGAGSDQIYLADTYVIHVEDKQHFYDFDLKDKNKKFSNLNIKVLDYHPHSSETLETWIKNDQVFIYGYKPFPLNDALTTSPKTSKASLLSDYPDFELAGFDILSEEITVEVLSREYYLKGLKLIVKERKTGNILYANSLKEALEKQLEICGVNFTCSLDFNFSTFLKFSEPSLKAKFTKENQLDEEILVALDNKNALENINLTTPYLGNSPYIVELVREPLLMFIQDLDNDIFVFVYDRSGRVYCEAFLKGHLNSFVSYDKGFHGYATQFNFPLNISTREDMEAYQVQCLKNSLATNALCSPPLELLRKACKKQNLDFSEVLINYLTNIDASHEIVYNGDFCLPELDLQMIDPLQLKACAWISTLLPAIMQKLEKGHDLIDLLDITGWPLIAPLKEIKSHLKANQNEVPLLIDALTEQIYALSEQLPKLQIHSTNSIFSSYLRLYGIRLNQFTADASQESIHEIALECPLTAKQQKLKKLQKLENNTPLIQLRLNNEFMSLKLDPFGTGLKWPTSDGNYSLRFQPKFKTIPYRLRLQNARQIQYPNSNSNYSFEADLIITDKKNLKTEETTISMNHVHETWDGYRFYLSNISQNSENEISQVQIVVNHDPAKYYLTYPGALILSFGIISLFWLSKYFK